MVCRRLRWLTVGFMAIVGGEHTSHALGDVTSHALLGHVSHGVLDQMELARLPGHAIERGVARGPETGAVVTDNALHAPHAAIDQRLWKATPARLGLAERDAGQEQTKGAILLI